MRFLFVDRILQLQPNKMVRGIKHITSDDFYLTSDEQGQRCLAPSLIGETLGQLAAWNVMFSNEFTKRPVAGVVERASLFRPAYVGETLLLESFIDQIDDVAVQYHSVARIGNEIVFTIDSALGPLLPMTDFIDISEIKKQFAEINRPGEWSEPYYQIMQFEHVSKSPAPHPTMTFDRIISHEPDTYLCAEKRLTRAAPYFADHFPNKPVLPLTILLECKLNLAREFFSKSGSYIIKEINRIKINEFIYPGDTVTCHVKVKHQEDKELTLNYRSEVAGKRVCILNIVLVKR